VACAQSMMAQSVVTELVFVDIKEQEKKLKGEVLDLMHGIGAAKAPFVKVFGSTDYTLTSNSDVIIVAG
jgi:malate/lactate dehydrogenase